MSEINMMTIKWNESYTVHVSCSIRSSWIFFLFLVKISFFVIHDSDFSSRHFLLLHESLCGASKMKWKLWKSLCEINNFNLADSWSVNASISLNQQSEERFCEATWFPYWLWTQFSARNLFALLWKSNSMKDFILNVKFNWFLHHRQHARESIW